MSWLRQLPVPLGHRVGFIQGNAVSGNRDRFGDVGMVFGPLNSLSATPDEMHYEGDNREEDE